MYKVKENGRANYQVFVPSMHDELLNRMRLERELKKALEKKEFCVYYQPIINLSTGKLAGFEALIRWNHPSNGLTSPGEFIFIAEKIGLIVDIGEWILREACLQLRIWQNKYAAARSLTMSVNVSGKQLKEKNLVNTIEQILQESQIQHHLLRLEITETVLMENDSSSIAILEELKQKGICLCLDDFGTGYSSLSYLHDFPISVVKVDQSFVQGINDTSNKIAIIGGIIALVHSLNMEVIAEGIESPEQQAFLQSKGCEYGQGYLFNRPLDSVNAERLILESGE
jgi:EAL domain-containing protein (putative c-di-GMP-specific phosphodiesterase class I)